LLPFNGINTQKELFSLIKFDNSSVSYLFNTNDSKGHLCTTSWNKLFGTNRCNNIISPHQDSDRFVWRRSQECVIFNGQYLLSEKSNCSEFDLVEVAAYAYDKADKPFENQGRLLKEFKNKVKVNQWYGYRLKINIPNTEYELSDSSGNLIESLTIEHRDCNASFSVGTLQGFYFGGQCPAPQPVSACYKNNN
jgi:hypothetical protein